MNNFKKIFLVSVSLFLASCQSEVSEQEVLGSWEYNNKGAYACIDVLADKTYRNIAQPANQEKSVFTGTWTWEQRNGNENWITFNHFSSISSDASKIKEPGFWMVNPSKGFLSGKIELTVSYDLDLSFTKRKDKCE